METHACPDCKRELWPGRNDSVAVCAAHTSMAGAVEECLRVRLAATNARLAGIAEAAAKYEEAQSAWAAFVDSSPLMHETLTKETTRASTLLQTLNKTLVDLVTKAKSGHA